jgi:hypothetical protein
LKKVVNETLAASSPAFVRLFHLIFVLMGLTEAQDGGDDEKIATTRTAYSGGRHNSGYWSARMMWRTEDAGGAYTLPHASLRGE